MIERFNRTIREMMFKYFTANWTRNILDRLVEQYNNTVHSSWKQVIKKKKIKFGEFVIGTLFKMGENR